MIVTSCDIAASLKNSTLTLSRQEIKTYLVIAYKRTICCTNSGRSSGLSQVQLWTPGQKLGPWQRPLALYLNHNWPAGLFQNECQGKEYRFAGASFKDKLFARLHWHNSSSCRWPFHRFILPLDSQQPSFFSCAYNFCYKAVHLSLFQDHDNHLL